MIDCQSVAFYCFSNMIAFLIADITSELYHNVFSVLVDNNHFRMISASYLIVKFIDFANKSNSNVTLTFC